MKKLGPIIVMISGIITLATSVLMLLILYEAIKPESFPEAIQKYIVDKLIKSSASGKIVNITMASVSLVQIILAIFSLKKPRGFSSIIIMIIIAVQIALGLYNGIKIHFTITNIVHLSFAGLAEIGMIVGVIQGNKNK